MELILPDARYEASYRQAIEEYARQGLEVSHFFGGSEACPQGLFARFAEYRAGQNLPQGYVSATHLWLVEGGEFLAEANIRHRLTPALERFAGNIGYAVRAGRWGRGLGTRLLAGALQYAKAPLGLTRVLITCSDENIGSARVIEKNGGVWWDTIENVIDGKPRATRRYWVKL